MDNMGNCIVCEFMYTFGEEDKQLEYLKEGSCSAECFYEDWMEKPSLNNYVSYTHAFNYEEAHEIFECLFQKARQSICILGF